MFTWIVEVVGGSPTAIGISVALVLVLYSLVFRSPRKSLKGQYVVITGAGGVLGRCMAFDFAKQGCNLVLWDLRGAAESAREVAAKYPELDIEHLDNLDVTNTKAVYQAAEKVLSRHQVDILVNNAGVLPGEPFFEASDDLVRRSVEVNQLAHFWTVKAFAPAMMERNSGHLVSVASSAGLLGVPRMVDYCSSKFGAVGFLEALRAEIRLEKGLTGVHTTTVCPYAIKTPLITGWREMSIPIVTILEPEWVSKQVVDGVRRNAVLLVLPATLISTIFMKYFFPTSWYETIASLLGVDKVMAQHSGRGRSFILKKE